MGEIDKSRELYSKKGDNSSRFEGKTVPWELTIAVFCTDPWIRLFSLIFVRQKFAVGAIYFYHHFYFMNAIERPFQFTHCIFSISRKGYFTVYVVK